MIGKLLVNLVTRTVAAETGWQELKSDPEEGSGGDEKSYSSDGGRKKGTSSVYQKGGTAGSA